VRYLIRRLGFFVITLWAAMTLNFFIPRLMPGSPEDALRQRLSKGGSVVSPEQLRTVLAEFGFDPDKNIVLQYGEYLKAMVTGHWGVSIGSSLGVPVTTLISDALPWTIGLVGIATVLAFALGTFIVVERLVGLGPHVFFNLLFLVQKLRGVLEFFMFEQTLDEFFAWVGRWIFC
jgi:peptide/nickel transport system permease protein